MNGLKVKDEKHGILGLYYKEQRVGSFWDNGDSFTVKVNPRLWGSEFEISERESYNYSDEVCIIVVSKKSEEYES